MNSNSWSPAVLLSASVVALSFGFFAGCTALGPSSSGGDAGGGANGDADAGGAALTCSEIFDCASRCPKSNDTTCEDACVERGSPQAKAAATGLVTCVQQNRCGEDPSCIQSKCQKEVQGCADARETPDGSAPAGQVPAELVGRWIGRDAIVDFRADGTVSYFISYPESRCSTLDNGTVVATGTNMTLYFTSGQYKCGWAFEPKTKTFTYTLEHPPGLNPVIHMKETNCSTSCESLNLDKE